MNPIAHHGELPVGDLQLGVGALLLEPKDGVEVAAGSRRGVAALLCPGIHAVVAGDVKLLRHARTHGHSDAMACRRAPVERGAGGGGGREGEGSKRMAPVLLLRSSPPLPSVSTQPQEASRNTAMMPTCLLNISPRRIFFFLRAPLDVTTSQLYVKPVRLV